MREYVTGLHLLWKASIENPVSFEGELFHVRDDVRFNDPVANSPRIRLGASRTGMARLEAELADGANFNAAASAPCLAKVIVPAVAEGTAKSGRTLDAVERGALAITAVSARRGYAYRLARHPIAVYSAVATYFEPVMETHCFRSRSEEVRAKFFAGDGPGAGVADDPFPAPAHSSSTHLASR